MLSEFSVDINMDFIIPDFMDASIPLQQCGEEIKNDAQRSIRLGIDFETDAPFAPLAKKTVKDKVRQVGFGNMPLFRKGIMYNAIHSYKVSNNTIVVGVIPRGNPPRDEVAEYHQEEGVNQYTRTIRRFLGVSAKRLQWIEARMQRWVNERIQKASHEYINLKI